MTEPSWPLRLAMYHFGSGDALFVGWFLLFLATRMEGWNWQQRWVALLGWLGVVWIVLSAWPSAWIQIVLLAFSLNWLAQDWWPKSWRSLLRISLRRIVVTLILTAMVCEIPCHRPVRLNVSPTPNIAVIGDSVTAGLEPTDRTWPRQLAERWGWTVFDASQQGATVRTAMKQLDALDGQGDALILEIGGIDVLEQTPVAQFDRDLDALLKAARARYATMVMTEIPLPPLCNRYGIEQRRLVRRCGVRLIPKREMIGVLASAGGTVDGVHLSNAGQTKLAEVMHREMDGSRNQTPGNYQRCESPKSSPSQPRAEAKAK